MWLGKLLCCLGFHSWEYVPHDIDRDLWKLVPFKYLCRRCGKGI